MVLVLGVGARRLAERHVEEQPADARDVAVDAVEHLAALLVAIEAGGDVVAQVAAGLAEADRRARGVTGRPVTSTAFGSCFSQLTKSRVAAKPSPCTLGFLAS